MKRHFSLVLVGLVAAFSPLISNGQVSLSVGVNIGSPADFTQPLTPLGEWVNVGTYGRCWHPNGVAADWQPYVNGQWVSTDAGWYWQSDEPWAWACYHYGSWVNEAPYGWCWIPGTEWAPAWVTWRESDNYIGWAPCGPNRAVLDPQFFVFAGIHDFGRDFHGRGDFVRNDRDFINQTRVINDFSSRNVNIGGREQRISYNRGPNVENIQRATGKTFQARPVQDVVRERQPANLRENNQPNRNEQRPGLQNEQQRNEEQRNRNEGIPPSTQQRPTNERPGQPNATPQNREIQPTGREHGLNTPSQQPQGPGRAQPLPPSQTERPKPTPITPGERQVPPTGQEHGISTPPQQREVPQRNQPTTSERPTQQPQRQVPPTGQEHGISTPSQQREVPTTSQPNRSERQASPTGQEHGISTPPQQRETTRPTEANPQKAQPAPRQEKAPEQKAPQPEQRKQDGNQ